MLDFFNLPSEVNLDSVDYLDKKIREIVKNTSVEVVGQMYKKFDP